MPSKPVGPVPRKTPLYQEDSNDLSYNWVSFFNVLRDNTYEIRDFELDIDPPSLSGQGATEVAYTAEEVEVDDAILSFNKPTDSAGYIVTNARAGDGQIFLTFGNFTGGSIDPGTESYLFTILKR